MPVNKVGFPLSPFFFWLTVRCFPFPHGVQYLGVAGWLAALSEKRGPIVSKLATGCME